MLAKPGDLGEEASDLDLRIDAGLDPAEQLDHIMAVHQHRGVRLLGIDRAYLRDRRRLGLGELAHRGEFQPSAVDLERAGGAHLGEQHAR